MIRKLLIFLLCIGYLSANAQETFTKNGVKDERPGIHLFKNATIHVNAERVLENAQLLIKDNEIVAVGSTVDVPEGAIIHDLDGKHIFPSFIELSSDYGQPKTKRSNSYGPQLGPEKKGAFSNNDALRAYYQAVDHFSHDSKEAAKWRKAGFGSVLSHQKDGLIRGSGTVVALNDAIENESILKEQASVHFSFDKGTSTQDNPSSLMGAIALIRQAYLNAEWYAKQDKFTDLSLESFNNIKKLPSIFEAKGDKLYSLRADKLGDQVGTQYIIQGSGDEYQRIEEIKSTNAQFIIPVNFPDAYDVEDPLDALNVSLADMKHWELAPYNPKMLYEEGVTFAITTDGLKNVSELMEKVDLAIQAGLPESIALKALTETPANYLNLSDKLGTLDAGKYANFIITDGHPLRKKTSIYENWTLGQGHIFKDVNAPNLAGKYELTIGDKNHELLVSGSAGSHKFQLVVNDSTKEKVKADINRDLLLMIVELPEGEEKQKIKLSGYLQENGFAGKAQFEDGSWENWNANRAADLEEEEEEKENKDEEINAENIGDIIYPFVAHGSKEKAQTETILIKNTTVWTNEEAGVLENTDVLLENGKISKIGKDLNQKGSRIIDGKGKHLTFGVIDEHSHIAISRGVNEASESVTAEVNIEDVVNSEDINIYRQLAGGVVASQLLHGSANPIGGRSALVKLKWGYSPEEMMIDTQDKFIKFALGENVKQSNWGDRNTVRYPQTRMGVEQVFVDAFTRAQEYEEEWKNYNNLSKREKRETNPPRKDIELETLVEIMNEERFISCHSYVQSEINMLMKVAERFGFRINTFTHILEGYKVADKMKEHGVGGSTFSDWWAYKFEVNDAIPYNAALMHDQGVVTAINSDDAEMGRRLNQEAAKTIKYGGVEEIEALKMVTLNPAKLLHLDDKMGSIKEGNSADVVLWTDHPLSIYAKADKTIIEGAVFFDLEKDKQLRKQIKEERARLIGKMTEAKKNGSRTIKAKGKSQIIYHCETEIQNYSTLK